MKHKERIDVIDIAKCLGFVCVVCGHSSHGLISHVLYLFHMPLFFILSGLVMKDTAVTHQIILEENRKHFVSYYFYVFIALIFFLFCNIIEGRHAVDWNIVLKMALLDSPGTLWFLGVLIVSRIALRIILKVSRETNCSFIAPSAVFLLYAAGWFICLNPAVPVDYLPSVTGSLTAVLLKTCNLTIFLYLGFHFKHTILPLLKKSWNAKSILLILVCSGFSLIPFAAFNDIDYNIYKNGMFLVNILTAVLGTVFILSLSLIIEKTPLMAAFKWFGRHSLFLMCTENLNLISMIKDTLSHYMADTPLRNLLSLLIYLFLIFLLVRFIAPVFERIISKITSLINRPKHPVLEISAK